MIRTSTRTFDGGQADRVVSDALRAASRDWRFAAFALSCMMWTIKRFLITIETPDWKDVQDIELLRVPEVGETIETKYGTCLVTQTDASPGTGPYAGKIICRMP